MEPILDIVVQEMPVEVTAMVVVVVLGEGVVIVLQEVMEIAPLNEEI